MPGACCHASCSGPEQYALRKWDGCFGDKYSFVVKPSTSIAAVALTHKVMERIPQYWWSALAFVYSDYVATWRRMDHANSAV